MPFAQTARPPEPGQAPSTPESLQNSHAPHARKWNLGCGRAPPGSSAAEPKRSKRTMRTAKSAQNRANGLAALAGRTRCSSGTRSSSSLDAWVGSRSDAGTSARGATLSERRVMVAMAAGRETRCRLAGKARTGSEAGPGVPAEAARECAFSTLLRRSTDNEQRVRCLPELGGGQCG